MPGVIGLLLVACLFVPPPTARDMALVYPGPTATIEGWNYAASPPSYSALHFTPLAERWQQSNSADRCHHDEFRWTSTLGYHATRDRCGPVAQDTVYDPPITLMPRRWDGRPWTRVGRSQVVDYADGRVRCRGVNEWRATVTGPVEITPGEHATHVTTEQTTTWTAGPCAPWATRWREDYYLTDHLRRSVGGNLDGSFRWDVWFDP